MSVVIETTLGDITVDLFLQQRPVTCLNFLKLCKMKYYNLNLFHSIRSGFIAQTGDPTGEGTNGESIFGVLEGPEKRFFSGEKLPKIRHTNTGTLSMVCTGEMMIGSQFFFTLAPDLDSLDSIHCVIGEVTEGHDILRKLNDVICDESHRPYRDVRITHTVVLEDPFNDPPGFHAPSRSPSPSAERLKGGRIAPDEDIDESQGKSAAEIQEIIEEKEAKARATILEIVGDLPDADIAPPENVLFVCKLNPVTTDEDLEIIFSRFGKIVSCEVIRDKKTGDSLQYAFVEFADKKSCEDAYFKMDNVLIDDRRIHVDFSQSVSKMRYLGKGRGVQYFNEDGEGKPTKNDHIRYSKGDFKNGRLPKQHEIKDGDRRREHSNQQKNETNDKRRSFKEERKRSRSRHRKSPGTSRTNSRRQRSNSRPNTAKSRDYHTTGDRREHRKSERSRDKISKEHRLRSPSRSRSNSRCRYERSHNEKNNRNQNDKYRSRPERKQDYKSREMRQEKLLEDKKNKTMKKSKSRSPVEKLSDQRKHGTHGKQDKEKHSKRELDHKPLQRQGKEIGSRSRSSSPKESKKRIKDQKDKAGSSQYQRNKIITSEKDMTEKSPDQGREIEKYQLSKWEREDTPDYNDTTQDHRDIDPRRSRSNSRSRIERSSELRRNRREIEKILPGQETPVDLFSHRENYSRRSQSNSRSRNEITFEQKSGRDNVKIIPRQETPLDQRVKYSRRSRSNSRSPIQHLVEQRRDKSENEREEKPHDSPSHGHRNDYSRGSGSNSKSHNEKSVERKRSESDKTIPRLETPHDHSSQGNIDKISRGSHVEKSIEQHRNKRENEIISKPQKPQELPSLVYRDKNSRRSRSISRTSNERSVEQRREGNRIVPSQEKRLHHASENHRNEGPISPTSNSKVHIERSVGHRTSAKSNDGEQETQHGYRHESTTRFKSRSISQSSIEKSLDSRTDMINYDNTSKLEKHQSESLKKRSSRSRSDVERSPEIRERNDKPIIQYDRVSHKHVDPHTHHTCSRTEQSEKRKPSMERSSNELSPLQRSRSHEKKYQSEEVSEKFSEQYVENDDNNTSSKEKVLSKHKHHKKEHTNIRKNASKIKDKENNKRREKIKEISKKRKKVVKRKKNRDSSSSSTDSSDSSSSSSSSSSDEDRKKKRRKKKLSTSSSSSESSTSSSSSSSSSTSSSSSDSEPHRKKRKKVVSSKASKKGKKK